MQLRLLGCALLVLLVAACTSSSDSTEAGGTQTASATRASSPAVVAGATSTPTFLEPSLPTPDTTRAASLEEGLAALRSVQGLDAVLAAIEAQDVSTLVSLFEMVTLNCEALGRAAGPDCVTINGAIEGNFEAATIEDGGTRHPLAEVRLTALLEAIMSAGAPLPVMATHDRGTPADSGVYYLAFEVPAFDASDPAFGYAEGVIGTGLGLKVESHAGVATILEFSLLSKDWNPLKWTQLDGAPNHELIFPEDLSQYPALYEE